ncbi:MAG: ParB/RepB/Spo0J family partition protein [Synergistetes bacterium]|nr:ParB/RepB/Spo0J family partition protein [Synergistota bacterium]
MWFGKTRQEKKEEPMLEQAPSSVTDTSHKELKEIPIDSIVLNPYQPRRMIDPESLKELAESIKEMGVLQPIIVRSIGKERYELVAGERRWRAARLAGLEKIPAMIMEATEKETLVFALVENLQRADLNPIEEAHGYKRLMLEFNLTQEEIAQMVGKKQSTIANKLRLLKLPSLVQERVIDGTITERHARALLKLPSESEILKALKQIEQRKLNVNQTEELVNKMLGLISREIRTKSAETPRSIEELRNLISKFLSKYEKHGVKFEIISDSETEELRIRILRGEEDEKNEGYSSG